MKEGTKGAESAPIRRSAWSKLANETSKSYHAFGAYLELGPKRSIAKARQILGKRPGYDRVLEKWSSQHDWGKRCEAFDASEFMTKLDGRTRERESFRQGLVDRLDDFREALIELALGKCSCRRSDLTLELSGHAVHCASKATPKNRISALKEAITLAGVAAPKKIELSGPDAAPLRFERDLDKELDNLTDAQLDKLSDYLITGKAAIGGGVS